MKLTAKKHDGDASSPGRLATVPNMRAGGSEPVSGRSPGDPPGSPRKASRRRENRPLWMLIPGGAIITAIIVVPLILGIYMSFQDLDQYTLRNWLSAPLIGFDNYVEALTRTSLLQAVWISVSYSVVATLVTIPLGVAAAIATQNRFRGRGLVRSLFLVPYVLPSFVVATVWNTMLRPDGIVTKLLRDAGLSPELFLNGPWAYGTLIFVQIWASWPFIYLLASAGLQSVDAEVHEASSLDGTSWWQKLRFVILPYLKGNIALAFVIATLNHINNFTLPFVLFGIPAPESVNTLPALTYTTSFTSVRFGLSAAMAVLSLILILIPLFIYLRAVKLDSDTNKRLVKA